MSKKNPHAVALGRLGGKVKSAKKAAAVRENGKLGGGQRKYPAGTTRAQRRHLRNVAALPPHVQPSPAQRQALADVAFLEAKQKKGQ